MTVPSAAVPSLWQELDAPRVPSEPERRLLTALAAVVDDPFLHDQVAAVVVDAVCRCGCSSVRLRCEEPPIATATTARSSAAGRDDHLAVEATASGRASGPVTVVLHVLAGRVAELEVFSPLEGAGVAVPLTGLTGLTTPTVG